MSNSGEKVIMLKKDPGGSSDATLKQDVAAIESALAKIKALRPVTWHWKDEADGTELQHGFIAQEVEKILPELVGEGAWRDGTIRKFLSANEIVPYLVGAIKEQQEQILALQRVLRDKE